MKRTWWESGRGGEGRWLGSRSTAPRVDLPQKAEERRTGIEDRFGTLQSISEFLPYTRGLGGSICHGRLRCVILLRTALVFDVQGPRNDVHTVSEDNRLSQCGDMGVRNGRQGRHGDDIKVARFKEEDDDEIRWLRSQPRAQ